jgi:hypothetical protein
MKIHQLLVAALLGLATASVAAQTAPMPDPASFAVGDRWEWRQIDNRTKLEEPSINAVIIEEKGNREVVFENLLRPVVYAFIREPSAKPWRAWPLEVGKQWSMDMDYERADGGKGNLKMDARVVAYEEVTVPAGKFMAFKIEQEGYVRTSAGWSGRMVETYWYAPEAKADAKHVRRVGNQDFTRELVKYPQAGAAQAASSVGASPAGAAASGQAGRLRELEQLRKDGLITQQEYEERRKAILSTL